MDELYLAYMALRRYDYQSAIAISANLLEQNPKDQYALLLKTEAETEASYYDETEFEANSLEEFELDHAGDGGMVEGTLPTSYRPSSRLQTGYVRPLTAALGRPTTKLSSRLGTARLATARLESGRKTASMTRMGTASINNLKSTSQLSENYGGKPLYGRVFINNFLRLEPLNKQDITPDPVKALAFLKSYGEARGSDWFYCDRAARCYYLLGNYEEAERQLTAALRFVPRESTAIRLQQAIVCQGKISQALELNKEFVDTKFNNSAKMVLSGALLEELAGNGTEALTLYSHALAIDPSSTEALAGSAALIASGWQRQATFLRESDAIELYRRLLMQRSSDPSIWNNLGVCYLADDLIGDAFVAFLTALSALNSSNLQSARLRKIRSDIFMNIGLTFLKTSDFEAANDAFECALFEDQTNCEAMINLGCLAARSGQIRRAAVLFQQAVGIDATCEVAKKNLSILALREGKIEKAHQTAVPGSNEWKEVINQLM